MTDNTIQLLIVSFHGPYLPSNNNQDRLHQSSGKDMEKNQLQYDIVLLKIQVGQDVLLDQVVLAHN